MRKLLFAAVIGFFAVGLAGRAGAEIELLPNSEPPRYATLEELVTKNVSAKNIDNLKMKAYSTTLEAERKIVGTLPPLQLIGTESIFFNEESVWKTFHRKMTLGVYYLPGSALSVLVRLNMGTVSDLTDEQVGALKKGAQVEATIYFNSPPNFSEDSIYDAEIVMTIKKVNGQEVRWR